MTTKADSVQSRVRKVLARHPDGLTLDGITRRLRDDQRRQVQNALTNMRQLGWVFHKGGVARAGVNWQGVWVLNDKAAEAKIIAPPKEKPCLVCGEPHKSRHAGDRLHKHCRIAAARDDHRFNP